MTKVLSKGVIASSKRRFDKDAQAYIDAIVAQGVTVSDVQSSALNIFYKTIKSQGIYSELGRMYLPIWANANANRICLKTLTTGTWNGTVTHAHGYAQSDGSTGYMDTGVNATGVGASTSSAYMCALMLTRVTSSQQMMGARVNINSVWAIAVNSSDNFTTSCMDNNGNQGNYTVNTGVNIGIMSHSRYGGERMARRRLADQRDLWGTEVRANFGTNPTPNVALFGLNISGTISNYTVAKAGAFAFGKGLSDTQDSNFTLALQTVYEACTSLVIPDVATKDYLNSTAISNMDAQYSIGQFVGGIKKLGLWNDIRVTVLNSGFNISSGTTAFSLGGGSAGNLTLVNSPTRVTDGIQITASSDRHLTVPIPSGWLNTTYGLALWALFNPNGPNPSSDNGCTQFAVQIPNSPLRWQMRHGQGGTGSTSSMITHQYTDDGTRYVNQGADWSPSYWSNKSLELFCNPSASGWRIRSSNRTSQTTANIGLGGNAFSGSTAFIKSVTGDAQSIVHAFAIVNPSVTMNTTVAEALTALYKQYISVLDLY
jgi:hypothetical protein